MARITTYATLATAVQAYLSRTDVGVASGNLDYLCSEAEEEMNSRLRVRRMLTAVTPTVSSVGVVTLPTDFCGWKRFTARNGASEWDLKLVAAENTTDVTSLYSTATTAGIPEALITTGTTSQIYGYTDATYTFTGLYFLRIPQLTAAATTNWVLTQYPNAYLYGCLAAARGFVTDDSPVGASRFDMWARLFSRAIDRINREDAIDLDARTNVVLGPDTALFGGTNQSNNIRADQ